MFTDKVVKETVKGVIAITVLVLITVLYAAFCMKTENDSYNRNYEKIQRIMDQNRMDNNNELIMGEMK
jgi:hypothetical protein